jgi:hypothetical protein
MEGNFLIHAIGFVFGIISHHVEKFVVAMTFLQPWKVEINR